MTSRTENQVRRLAHSQLFLKRLLCVLYNSHDRVWTETAKDEKRKYIQKISKYTECPSIVILRFLYLCIKNLSYIWQRNQQMHTNV